MQLKLLVLLRSLGFLTRGKTMRDIFNVKIEFCEVIKQVITRAYELQRKGAIIQAQPLGMMRLALEGQNNADSGLFLHFWAPDLPKSLKKPPLHTHVFHMRSRIIKGMITDTTYRAIPDKTGDYQLVDAECTQEYCSMLNNLQRVRIEIESVRELVSGEIYEVPKGDFHLTSLPNDVQTAITIMEKSMVDRVNPVLALPYKSQIDNTPFDRMQLDQKAAWKRILESLHDQIL